MNLNMGMMSQILAAYTGDQFMDELGDLVVVLVSIAGAFMTIYAVYIGYLFATASDANKRKAAKDRLIKVVASGLIIVGLAAVLAVINVRFDKVEGSIKKPGSTGGVDANCSYAGRPSLKFKADGSTVVATFDVHSKDLKSEDGAYIDSQGVQIKFTACEIQEPGLEGGMSASFNNGTIGEGTYKISFSRDQSFPYAVRAGEGNVIVAKVSFCYKDDPGSEYSVDVIVQLDESSARDAGVDLRQAA